MHQRDTRILVKKINIGCGQLETAIQLWFQEGDPVSVHTLASAARDVLRVLYEHSEAGPFPSPLPKNASKTQREKLHDQIKITANFFKHAGKDRNHSHDFSPEVTARFMLEAIHLFKGASKGEPTKGQATTWMLLYQTYLTTVRPDWFSEKLLGATRDIIPAYVLKPRSRLQFFEKFCIGLPKCQPFGAPTPLPFRVKRTSGPWT